MWLSVSNVATFYAWAIWLHIIWPSLEEKLKLEQLRSLQSFPGSPCTATLALANS